MKRITYSLFGYHPKYYVGAEKNITINQELLPDWTTVIYYNRTNIIEGVPEKLSSLGATMVDITDSTLCTKQSLHYPYFWRFLSFFEEGLSISRDLDSRLSTREVEYIRRWENSDRTYFIIRDHPWHSPVPAGLIGMKGSVESFKTHFINYIDNTELVWGTDQEIFHPYMETVTQEEIYYCGLDRSETYIPRDDPNFFIGMQIGEDDMPLKPNAEVALAFLQELNY